MERSLEQLRSDAVAIFNAAVRAVDAANAVRRSARLTGAVIDVADRSYSLGDFQNIYILGAGKAAVPMAQAMETLLGERVSDGIVVTKKGQGRQLRKTRVIEAAHPIPDIAGEQAAHLIAAMAQQATAQDLVFFLVSGGGSALMPYPVDGVTLADKQTVTHLLLRSGGTIQETNMLRRHLSQLKGGKLARLAYPAQVITLIVSDVVGDSLEDIASGPTAPDPSRYADCWEIIRKYRLQDLIPAAVRATLDRGIRGEIAETVKAGDAAFANVHNVIIASNRHATEAARWHAESLGYRATILSNAIEGESREVAKRQAAAFKKALSEPPPEPLCFISGGETTVTVSGDGVGGRNQEYALAAAIELAGARGVVALCAGTDGIDGPTDAAGAVVDGATVLRGRVRGCDATAFLARNDSYHFLQATADLLITGPTETNVMDLQVMLAGSSQPPQ
jgi:hydroxypyruvate reductase